MSAEVVVSTIAPDHAERRIELHRRFLLVGLRDPGAFESIPPGATLYLLPDDDARFAAAEIAAAARAAHRGVDVYLRHIRMDRLPR